MGFPTYDSFSEETRALVVQVRCRSILKTVACQHPFIFKHGLGKLIVTR